MPDLTPPPSMADNLDDKFVMKLFFFFFFWQNILFLI